MSSAKQIGSAILSGVIGAAVVVQALAGATVANAQAVAGIRVGPNQIFGALVNGESGKASPVIIRMGCGGPETPGRTGHPSSGQTVTVFLAASIAGEGNTGAHGREIGAFFGAPPPSPTAAAASGPIIFDRYVTKKIPTSEVLPCEGKGQIYFVPLPMSPGSEKDVVIPVAYVSVALTP